MKLKAKEIGEKDSQLEHDISLMDPTLFEDPILLLEYLQNADAKKDASTVTSKANHIIASEKQTTRQNNKRYSASSKYEEKAKGKTTLQEVKKALYKSVNGLSLYEIQDRTGINDLDDIIEALESLRQTGRIERVWSRKNGGRSVYKIKPMLPLQEEITENKEEAIEKSKGKDSSIVEIENEILRIFRLTGYPISVENLKWKSIKLNSINKNELEAALINLKREHRLFEYTCNKGQTEMYALAPADVHVETSVSNQSAVQSEKNEKRKKTPKEDYLDRIAEIHREASKEKVKKWEIDENQAPYGYKVENGTLSINTEEARVVRRVFELYDYGESLNATEVANILNQEGHRTRTGCLIRSNLVLKIWRDEYKYLGKSLKYGNYPPIIEPRNNEKAEAVSPKKDNIRQAREPEETPEKQENTLKDITGIQIYSSVDEFLDYVKSIGVLIKDNRIKDGCVWIKADPLINEIIDKVQIKGRGFKYAIKCRAFDGFPAWYY